MKLKLHSTLILSVTLLLSACASTPDPAEVCTAEWITPRTSSAIGKIEKRAKSSMKTLTSVSKTYSEGKKPNLFQLLALSNAMNNMKKELTRGQGIKDLKTLATTCNDPNIIKDSMRDMMKRQGIDDSFIQRIETNPIYESLISSISQPEPVASNG